jgi:hypothetical protein
MLPIFLWIFSGDAMPTHCWAFLDSMGSVTSPEADRHHVSGLMVPTLTVHALGLFPGRPWLPGQSGKSRQRRAAVTSSGPRNVDLVPIGATVRVASHFTRGCSRRVVCSRLWCRTVNVYLRPGRGAADCDRRRANPRPCYMASGRSLSVLRTFDT